MSHTKETLEFRDTIPGPSFDLKVTARKVIDLGGGKIRLIEDYQITPKGKA